MRENAYNEYQAGWGAVLDQCKDAVKAGNTDLSRVLSLVSQPMAVAENERLLKRYGFRICGNRVQAPADLAYEDVFFRAIVERELVKAIDPDTANVVELGSGYSNNLFSIWLKGGPLTAQYVGLEFTEAGRDCGRFLSSLEPRIKYEVHPFDYYQPAIPLADKSAKTFAFSCYSIEQITTLGTKIFDELLRIPGLYKVVHMEPVGWQTGPKLSPFPSEYFLWQATRRRALQSKYNTDLLKVLGRLADEGKIIIDEPIRVDYLAHRPDLPGTVITWRPRK